MKKLHIPIKLVYSYYFRRKYWPIKLFIDRWYDKICLQIAWWLPKRICTHVFCRVSAHGTCGKYSNTLVPAVTAVEILKRWGDKDNG